MQLLSWLQGFAVALVALNVVATIVLLFASGVSWRQCAVQTVIVWLLPVLGALLVLHLHVDALSRPVRRRRLSPKAAHPYVTQALEAEARLADHAARAELEHSVIDTLSHSDGGAGDGH